MPMYNCMLVDYKKMFEKSFLLNNAIITEPRSIQVACTVASQISAGVASSQYGGQTFNRFDEYMAKYVSMSYIKILIDVIQDVIFEEEDVMNKMIKDIKELYWKDNENVKDIEYINNNFFDDFNRISPVKYTKIFIEGFILKNCKRRIESEVYDAIQCLEYQINTISSTNG